MKQFVTCVVALTVFLLSGNSFSQVYKWVDKDGKTHYSDVPVAAEQSKIRLYDSTVGSACDERCRARLARDRYQKSYDEILRGMPRGECKFKYHAINPTSKQLAEQATEECKRNYVRSRLAPNYVLSTEAAKKSAEFNRYYSGEARRIQAEARQEQRDRELQSSIEELERSAKQAQQKPDRLILEDENMNRIECTQIGSDRYSCGR